MHARRFVVAFGTLALAGCALNPPPPASEIRSQALPNARILAQWTAPGGAPASVGDGWLASFNDPVLDALVREALAYNSDLRVAAARVEVAAGYVRLSGATL